MNPTRQTLSGTPNSCDKSTLIASIRATFPVLPIPELELPKREVGIDDVDVDRATSVLEGKEWPSIEWEGWNDKGFLGYLGKAAFAYYFPSLLSHAVLSIDDRADAVERLNELLSDGARSRRGEPVKSPPFSEEELRVIARCLVCFLREVRDTEDALNIAFQEPPIIEALRRIERLFHHR